MIRIISGLMKPRSGEILFEGQPIHTLQPEKIVEKGIKQVHRLLPSFRSGKNSRPSP